MKVKFICFVLFSVLFSCKSTKKKINLMYSIKSIYNNLLNQNKIGDDPILLFDNENLGKLSLLDLDGVKFQNINSNSINYLEKGSYFYMMKFGEQAKDGALIITNRIYLDSNAAKYYLVDGNLVDHFLYKGIDIKKIDRISNIPNLKDINGDLIELNIITFIKTE